MSGMFSRSLSGSSVSVSTSASSKIKMVRLIYSHPNIQPVILRMLADHCASQNIMASAEFDMRLHFVTSEFFSPIWLACIRLLIAFYALVVLVFTMVCANNANLYFSFFTNLSYIGLCAYFLTSGVQTFAYAKNLKNGNREYPLQHWPGVLRYLHGLLLSTVVTFPILVTLVYWWLLSSASTFETPYSTWSNISKHALNSAMALFEVALTNIGPLPWIDLPVTIVFLGGYLGVAYITHATQGIYPYPFLDPKKQGKLLAVYIIGIAVGQCIVFLVVTSSIHLRGGLRSGTKAHCSDD